ncbi:MAG TPA: hypothetical protein VN605_12335 [Thermoanaerobaculia bacterium]|nr:hypothetical protein [Thermoanaerobaculia bacterium]
MLEWLSVAAVIIVALLGWNLYRRFGADRIGELNERRRLDSRIVSRGELVDGNRHLAVALALTQSTFFYENADIQGSIDLEWLREIEYDNELATGSVVEGGKVLRLRSNSQMFEFVLPKDIVPRWHLMLPPRRGPAARADTAAALGEAVPSAAM